MSSKGRCRMFLRGTLLRSSTFFVQWQLPPQQSWLFLDSVSVFSCERYWGRFGLRTLSAELSRALWTLPLEVQHFQREGKCRLIGSVEPLNQCSPNSGFVEPYFEHRTISVLRSCNRRAACASLCYDLSMTKLLEEAIHRLRQLPAPMQDSAARAVILQLEEEPEPGDREAVAAGRSDFQNGDFVTLEQLRHEMGSRDR
jgi:hypothetical protein